MVIQEFNTLEEFDDIDAIKYKDYDRLVVDNITLLPTDVLQNALFKCYIRDYKKFIIIKNETYEESYNQWREKHKREDT